MVGLETFPAMLDSQRSFGHGTEGPLAHFRTGCSRERAVRPSSYTLNRFQKIDRLSESSTVDIEAGEGKSICMVSLFSEDGTSSPLQHFFVVKGTYVQVRYPVRTIPEDRSETRHRNVFGCSAFWFPSGIQKSSPQCRPKRTGVMPPSAGKCRWP